MRWIAYGTQLINADHVQTISLHHDKLALELTGGAQRTFRFTDAAIADHVWDQLHYWIDAPQFPVFRVQSAKGLAQHDLAESS